jgi:2-polyprenyl-3-methyl-5-hydroxy-6-metoxy-1,4-benzoquinol methylase
MSADNVVWERQDILAISYPPNSFDTVFSLETIEHVTDPSRAVRELARVLRPGGHLFLTTPNYLGVRGLYRSYLWLRGREFPEVGQPINQLTMIPRTLHWLSAAGLRTVRVRCSGHYLPFPRRTPNTPDFSRTCLAT